MEPGEQSNGGLDGSLLVHFLIAHNRTERPGVAVASYRILWHEMICKSVGVENALERKTSGRAEEESDRWRLTSILLALYRQHIKGLYAIGITFSGSGYFPASKFLGAMWQAAITTPF
jgi:hypothetical protein